MDVYVVTVPADQIHFSTIALDEGSKNFAEDPLDLVSYAVVHPRSRLLTRSYKYNVLARCGRAHLAGDVPLCDLLAL